MITRFLQDNENKEIRLIWGFDEFTGILTYHGRDWWIVAGQAFHINQVSTYGYPAYVVVS
jgi:hypothetical protein